MWGAEGLGRGEAIKSPILLIECARTRSLGGGQQRGVLMGRGRMEGVCDGDDDDDDGLKEDDG